ncbi:MAG: MTH938/NDUFAF3 family protein, partial [Candidatus Neomarinimicrobiota bacterium]
MNSGIDRQEIKIASPRIVSLSWGRVEVAGGQVFKDVILYPGGCREWDWRLTGINHSPGILPADLELLLANGVARVVLSRGMNGRLQVAPETERLLTGRNIETHIARTEEAVRIYNQLRESGPTGA